MAEITTTERLPFPLAKPNPDTFATKTSEIGHNGEPLDSVIGRNTEKINRAPAVASSDANSSFDIADANGYVILRLKNGEIETKKFNSSNSPKIGDNSDDSDLYITDGNGNIIVELKGGHIRMKNFDSRTDTGISVEVKTENNKNILVFS